MGAYGEIVSVLTRIQLSVDHQDRDGFADCWTEDTHLQIELFDGTRLSFESRAQLLAGATANWSGQASPMRHLVGVVDVRLLDEDAATAHFYCSYYKVGAAAGFAGLGEYWDELARGADKRWRVRRRRHQFLTPLEISLKA